MGCISAKSKLSAFDLHHLCHHFKCIYAKENLKTNIMKSFKSTAWLLPQPVLIIGTYDKELMQQQTTLLKTLNLRLLSLLPTP